MWALKYAFKKICVQCTDRMEKTIGDEAEKILPQIPKPSQKEYDKWKCDTVTNLDTIIVHT